MSPLKACLLNNVEKNDSNLGRNFDCELEIIVDPIDLDLGLNISYGESAPVPLEILARVENFFGKSDAKSKKIHATVPTEKFKIRVDTGIKGLQVIVTESVDHPTTGFSEDRYKGFVQSYDSRQHGMRTELILSNGTVLNSLSMKEFSGQVLTLPLSKWIELGGIEAGLDGISRTLLLRSYNYVLRRKRRSNSSCD